MPTLRELIESTPAAAACVAVRDDGGAAALLNSPAVSVVRPYMMTKRQLHVDFGFMRGTTILTGLKLAAASQSEYAPAFAELVSLLESDIGLDIGRPAEELAALKALIVGATIATAEEMDVVIGHGQQLVGAAMAALGHDATDVEIAREFWEERNAADEATYLAERTTRWQTAKAAWEQAGRPIFGALADAYQQAASDLRQTIGGQEVIDGQ